MPFQSGKFVDHLFRTEYGKLIAILTRVFGPEHIQLAEDVVQETLIAAMNHWSTGEVPDNPTGWLVQVAKRKALNELNRHQRQRKWAKDDHLVQSQAEELQNFFLEEEIEDSQLRMIFTCCHPVLSIESQIALTLKTLCGFGVKEVANALLSSVSTINKRLYRAKQKIREADVLFHIPQGEELDERLTTVSLTLYLLFNEGYNSSAEDEVIKKDLCLEAIRLTKLLVDRFQDNASLKALLALMCLHTARFEARLDHHGAIILFEEQNRQKWNQEMIQYGMYWFRQSFSGHKLSVYHVEARIAAEHCLAKSFEATQWKVIEEQYQILAKLKPNPIIQLNLAIIQRKTEGVEASLLSLEQLEKTEVLSDYFLLPVSQGVFNVELNQKEKAVDYFYKALKMSLTSSQKQLVEQKIQACKRA